MTFPEPSPGPDSPAPPLPDDGGGALPSDVPNTLPGRPDPFTGQGGSPSSPFPAASYVA